MTEIDRNNCKSKIFIYTHMKIEINETRWSAARMEFEKYSHFPLAELESNRHT